MPRGVPKKRVQQKSHVVSGQPGRALLRLTLEFDANTVGLANAKALVEDARNVGEVIYAEVSGFKTIDLNF